MLIFFLTIRIFLLCKRIQNILALLIEVILCILWKYRTILSLTFKVFPFHDPILLMSALDFNPPKSSTLRRKVCPKGGRSVPLDSLQRGISYHGVMEPSFSWYLVFLMANTLWKFTRGENILSCIWICNILYCIWISILWFGHQDRSRRRRSIHLLQQFEWKKTLFRGEKRVWLQSECHTF